MFVGTPATVGVAGAGLVTEVGGGHPLRATADLVLDIVSRPARDSGAPLGLSALYLNRAEPASLGAGVRAIAEGGVLQLHPEVVNTIGEVAATRAAGSIASADPASARRMLSGIHLLLYEGDHLAGPAFDRSRAGLDATTSAALLNAEEGLAELRASHLLPEVVQECFHTPITFQQARSFEGIHSTRANVMSFALEIAAERTGRFVRELTTEFADHVPSGERLTRLESLIAHEVSGAEFAANLAIQGRA